MSVNVKGRNINVTPALKEYVEKKITKVTKQFKTVGDISAVLKVEHGNHIVAVAAVAVALFAEVAEQYAPAAYPCLGVCLHPCEFFEVYLALA